jgi:diguanylate cyclase (GGDEF)-like protein
LRLFAEVLRACVRDGYLAARWGGEEFAIILPNTTAQLALKLVDRVRNQLTQALLTSGIPPFASSFGVADSTMSDEFDNVVRLADDALYCSKDAGRDQGTIADPNNVSALTERRKSEHDSVVDMGGMARMVEHGR